MDAVGAEGTPVDCVSRRGEGVCVSFTATRTPDVDTSVFRGLEYGVLLPEFGSEDVEMGERMRETPGRRPPSAAARGRLVRCQS